MDAAQGMGELPPELAETYEVGRLLGAGAFGRVLKATRRGDGAGVAIKVLSPEVLADPRLAERFQREGRIGARLASPFLVRTLDGGVSGGVPYLVMEWIDGPSLEEVLRGARERLDRGWVVKRVGELMAGLEVLHRAGTIHRDIKPANVLLRGGEQAVLADLGLARSTGELTLTRTGEILGSPAYMAPEQMLGEVAGAPTMDIYALGVLTFELFTGRLPFEHNTLGGILQAKQRGLAAGLRAERVEASPELDHLMRAWLDPEPAGRPPDVAALRAAWDSALAAPAGLEKAAPSEVAVTAPLVAAETQVLGGEAAAPGQGAAPMPPPSGKPAPSPAPAAGGLHRSVVAGATALLVAFGFFQGSEETGPPAPPPAAIEAPWAALDEALAILERGLVKASEHTRFFELEATDTDEDKQELRSGATRALLRAARADGVPAALEALADAQGDPPDPARVSRLTDVLISARLVLHQVQDNRVVVDREGALDDLGRALRGWVRTQDVPELSQRSPPSEDTRAEQGTWEQLRVQALGGTWLGVIDPTRPPGNPSGWASTPCGEDGSLVGTHRLRRSTWVNGAGFQRFGPMDGAATILGADEPCQLKNAPTRRRFPLRPVQGDLVLVLRGYGFDPTTQLQLTLRGAEDEVRLPVEVPVVQFEQAPDTSSRQRQAFLVRVHRTLVPAELEGGELSAFAVPAFASSPPSVSLWSMYQQVDGDLPVGLGDSPGDRVGAAIRALRDRVFSQGAIPQLLSLAAEDRQNTQMGAALERLLPVWRAARRDYVEALVAARLDAPEAEAFPGPLDLPSLRAAAQVLGVQRLLEWRRKDGEAAQDSWSQEAQAWPLFGGPDGDGPLLGGLERLVGASVEEAVPLRLLTTAHRREGPRLLAMLEEGGRSWGTLEPMAQSIELSSGTTTAADFRLRGLFPDGSPWPDNLDELARLSAPPRVARSLETDRVTPHQQTFPLQPRGAGPLTLVLVLGDWPDGLGLRLGLVGAAQTYELPLEVPSAGRSMAGNVAQPLAVRIQPSALPRGLRAVRVRALGLAPMVRDKPTVGVHQVFQQRGGEPLQALGAPGEAVPSGARPPPRPANLAALVRVHRRVLTDSTVRDGLLAGEWEPLIRRQVPRWLSGRQEFQLIAEKGGLAAALDGLAPGDLGVSDATRIGELALVHRLFSEHRMDGWPRDAAGRGTPLSWGRDPQGEVLEGLERSRDPKILEALSRFVVAAPFEPMTGVFHREGRLEKWMTQIRERMADEERFGRFEAVLPHFGAPQTDFRIYTGIQHDTYARVHRLRRHSFSGRPFPNALGEHILVEVGKSSARKHHAVDDRYSPEVLWMPLERRPRPEGLTLVFSTYSWRGEVGWLELEGGPGTHPLRVPFSSFPPPPRPEDDDPVFSPKDETRAGVALWVHPGVLPPGLQEARLRVFGARVVGHTTESSGIDEVFEQVEGPRLVPRSHP